jgi:hypothetical protein
MAMVDHIHMNTLPVRPALHTNWPRLRFLPVCLALFVAAVPAPATTVRPPEFDNLVGQADYIVRAVVKSVTSELRTSGPHRHIITKVELEVREVISGTPPQPLVLEMLGGRVGEEEMVVDGAPKFKVGDEDILFVHGNGRLFTPLVALMHGRYPIKRDAGTGREYVTHNDGSPLTSEQEVSQPMAERLSAPATQSMAPTTARSSAPALSPEDFVSRIKAAGARNAAHPPQQN